MLPSRRSLRNFDYIWENVIVMVFKIIKKCFQDARHVEDDRADFFLEKNDWNDYSYLTQFHLHATSKITGDSNEYLGPISIMRYGQSTNEYPLEDAVGNEYLSELPEDFCSLSFSLDLFAGLARYLNLGNRIEFVRRMHLILDMESPYYERAKDDECFNTSLLRGASMDSFALEKGKSLIYNTGQLYDLHKQELIFRLPGQDEEIRMKFTPPFEDVPDNYPLGVFAFIGKNGSGKSTVLYRLAKLLYADPKTRAIFADKAGVLTPSDIGIYKLIFISYSAFDNFVLPGMNRQDYKMILDRIEENDGRFVFCGLRDIKAEYEALLESEEEEIRELALEDRIFNEGIRLKPQERLGTEFAKAHGMVWTSQQWKNMLKEAEELEVQVVELSKEIARSENPAQFYNGMSTGYKFFFHALAHVMAYIESDSMVLIDEPENYLHPPLLSFLIRQLRNIMKDRHSVLMIATHSPVVLQEVMSENVRIIRRNGNTVCIRKPVTETYGENLSAIVSDVFNLTSDNTGYYDVFDSLYDKWECSGMETAERVLRIFTEKLGARISTQMAQYLISKWITDNRG